MALWGISTSSETVANNFAIPKHLKDTDRRNSPWNCFADCRGWILRRYGTSENSGLSTQYYDEILVPVIGLNTTSGSGGTGIGTAGPIAVFFEDPNLSSKISIGAGATSGIGTGRTGYIHVVFNELVFASAGATALIRTYDAANLTQSTSIVATASSNRSTQYAWSATARSHGSPDTFVNYNGQICNRVAFAFTAPNTLLTADVNFLTTAVSATGVGIGATIIYLDSVTNVSVGSSLSVSGKLVKVPVTSIGSTFVTIGTASTIGTTMSAGLAATFSTFTTATILKIDHAAGFVGVITDGSNGVGVISSFSQQFAGYSLIRNVGGAGTTGGVGIGTTTLTVKA